MNGKTALKLLNSGIHVRIKCWPENFYIYKLEEKFIFSDGRTLEDLSIFEVNDWEEFDSSAPFFSARCESERLNKLKLNSLEDDIIDL